MFRKIILAEMERQRMSRYAMVKRVANRIPQRTVYNYLSGKSDLAGEKVSILAAELNLSLRSKGRK